MQGQFDIGLMFSEIWLEHQIMHRGVSSGQMKAGSCCMLQNLMFVFQVSGWHHRNTACIPKDEYVLQFPVVVDQFWFGVAFHMTANWT